MVDALDCSVNARLFQIIENLVGRKLIIVDSVFVCFTIILFSFAWRKTINGMLLSFKRTRHNVSVGYEIRQKNPLLDINMYCVHL